MINTNRKKRRSVVLLVIAMLLAMTLSVPVTFAAEAVESFTFPKGVTRISIDLVITENQAYGGLQFGVSCSNGLQFDGFDVNKDLLLEVDISGEKNGVHYYGFYGSDNIYQGTLTIGTLHFLYDEDGKETVTINELTLGRYEDNQKVSQDPKGARVYEVSRITKPSPGNGGDKETIGTGEEEPPLTVAAFSDITGHWAEQDILSAVEKGFVAGYLDGTFRPNNPVTRAEFVTMLVKANVIQNGVKSITFSDVTNHWALSSIMTAASNEYVNGYPDGTFRPNNNIVRQEVAKVMADFKTLSETDVVLPFKDVSKISAWAIPSAKKVYQAGIIKGDASNKFAPLANTTRAEAVAIILRCMN
jgi:hypothetical protein